jgi:hypothetical protein
MMPCDWIGIVIMRIDTLCKRSMTGMMKFSPGCRTAITRPSRNSTPR